jgi:hypothetical protein
MNFFIRVCQKEDMRRKVQAIKRASHKKQYLYRQQNPLFDGCRGEVLATVAFFRRLEAQELPFLTGASGDITTIAAS